jgi:hypothetical protein
LRPVCKNAGRADVRAAFLKAQAAYNPEYADETLLLTLAGRPSPMTSP